MLAPGCSEKSEFWSDVYCGRPIAVFHRHGRWHAYLDHVFQHNVVFANGQDAVIWLMQRIDHGVPARLN